MREKENNKQQRRGKKKTKPKDTNNIGYEKISWTKDSIQLFKKNKIKSPSPICCIRGGKTDKLFKKKKKFYLSFTEPDSPNATNSDKYIPSIIAIH